MSSPTVEREQLIEEVNSLPDEFLAELASFLDYLRYKTLQQQSTNNNTASFLASISGLGNSGQTDTSERDEEILRNEVDPVYGWNFKPKNQV